MPRILNPSTTVVPAQRTAATALQRGTNKQLRQTPRVSCTQYVVAVVVVVSHDDHDDDDDDDGDDDSDSDGTNVDDNTKWWLPRAATAFLHLSLSRSLVMPGMTPAHRPSLSSSSLSLSSLTLEFIVVVVVVVAQHKCMHAQNVWVLCGYFCV